MHPVNVISLSDGGAHRLICDASAPTFLISHWVHGPQWPASVGAGNQAANRETALLYGLDDRGALLEGLKANINLIDFDQLNSRAPEIVYDFPAGGKRFVQHAEGYKYTVVSGEVVLEDGQPLERCRGKVVRGGKVKPS